MRFQYGTLRLAFRLTASAAAVAMAVGGQNAFAFNTLTFETPGADKDLRAVLGNASLLLAAEKEKTTDPQDLLAAAQGEYGRLLGALYAEGYYSGVIHITLDGSEAANIPALSPPASISTIAVTVTPGPRFVFSRAEVAPRFPGSALPERFATGRIARSGVMEEAVGSAIDIWRANGHAKAKATGQQITADHRANTVAARFSLNPGPRLRFGTLTITGNQAVRTDRIRAIAGYPAGAPFDPAALEKSAARLRRTGAFKSVSMVEADQPGPGDTLGIEAAVAEAAPRRLGFGAEIASLDGATLSGYWLHRNLFGGAEQFRVDGKISGIGGASGGADYSLGARLARPGTPDPDTEAYLKFLIEHEDEADFTADRGTIELGFNRVLTETLTADVGLGFAYERSTDILGTTNFSNLYLPLGIRWDRRDVALNPTKGTYADLRLTPFLGFQSAGTGARLGFDARAYQGFGADRTVVLAGRIQGGTVFGASIAQTPRDYLFYSGGGGTVRGQPYQSLGVSTACGAGCTLETGGRSFLGVSGELRAPVGKNLGLVGFADAGYVSAGNFTAGEWHSGAGLGLRYNTGIGPIRLDVAAPVGGKTGNGVQVYVGIGQAF